MKKYLMLSALMSANVFAWGPTGHRAVGEIASKHLTPAAELKVMSILKGQTLAKVSTWPDEIKSEPATYSHTYSWHYTDWPDEAHEHNETQSSGQLLGQINEQLKVMKDSAADADKKAFALKFLVHLVGDLHMPLHVGNGVDQGGNFCKVTFHNRATNLHALWDEGMIDFTNLSFTELASFAQMGRTPDVVAATRLGSVMEWAAESKKLRMDIYPAADRGVFCRKEPAVTAEEMPKLGYEYSYKFMPVVEERIFQAGIRLAELINQNL